MADERFLYFAYGSNMLTRRLRAGDRCPSARPEGTGFVPRHRLTFDKVSKGTVRNSGKCDMEATGNPTDRVYGVLFSIAMNEEKALDDTEGLDKGYRKDRQVSVVTANGPKTAVAYVATQKDPSSRPYHWYKALVVAGAVEHGLPNSYVEWLRTFDSQPDSDAKRRAENEAVLFES